MRSRTRIKTSSDFTQGYVPCPMSHVPNPRATNNTSSKKSFDQDTIFEDEMSTSKRVKTHSVNNAVNKKTDFNILSDTNVEDTQDENKSGGLSDAFFGAGAIKTILIVVLVLVKTLEIQVLKLKTEVLLKNLKMVKEVFKYV